jgi:hypothetical protein
MREEHDSRLAASKRIQAEQERDRRAEARKIHKDMEIFAEVRQLQQERKIMRPQRKGNISRNI